MSAKRYFSYIRVSTARQGQKGTSLAEQRSAIERYARQWNLTISKEYVEMATAAKQGRPVFTKMVQALRRGRMDGVITHNLDRSARNLEDWIELRKLADHGFDVQFADEPLDLASRGGRLTANIKAVVAEDFISNLREETKKGIYGRLKQGLFPFRAVPGYLDSGGGKPKRLDPVQAPLIRRLFELYATGDWGLDSLVEEMHRAGLRSRNGNKVTRNGLSTILHNPFYMGVIRIRKTGQLFQGVHEPIVSKELFDHVQGLLDNKDNKKTRRHFFVFSKHIVCSGCGGKLIAELQKGYTYYRCQTRACPQKTVREEVIEVGFADVLKRLRFNEREQAFFLQEIQSKSSESIAIAEAQKRGLEYRLEQIAERQSRLADAYVDRVFDEDTYRDKRNALILEEKGIREKLERLHNDPGRPARLFGEFLELANSAYTSYERALPAEKRELVKIITSNFVANGKSVSIKLNLPFSVVLERQSFPAGSPYGAATRTLKKLFDSLLDYFSNPANSKSLSEFS